VALTVGIGCGAEVCTRRRARGRLICHTSLQALTVFALTSAMILTPLRAETPFITAIGFATLLAARFFSATRAAITLATITVAADVKHHAARRKMTNELVKDCE
jgi:hypothetical protein